ncbi:MAG TPA: hypothetical protein PLV45_11935, partial [bacterium]|nr:hypothetical protein [bacterium]
DRSYDGMYSTMLSKTPAGPNDAGSFVQWVPYHVNEDAIYTLSAWMFDNDIRGRARIYIRWRDASGIFLGNSPYSDYTVTSASWQLLSVTDQSPVGASYAEVVVRVYDEDEQDVIINVDAVSLMEPCDPVFTPTPTATLPPTTTPTLAPCDTNIIPNADFSGWTLGDLNHWHPETGIIAAQDTANLRPGTADTIAVNLSRTLISGTDLTSEYIPVYGGQQYEAGIWVIDDDADVNIRFYVLFYKIVGGEIRWFQSSAWIDTSGQSPDYQELTTGTIPTSPEAVLARVRVRFFDEDGTFPGANFGTVTIDDAWLVEPCVQVTPTPTTAPTAAVSATIYQIQYTTSGSGSSPFAGTTVRTQGIVTAVEDGNPNVFIQDQTAPWSGLHVYFPTGVGGLQRGDNIVVQGPVTEMFGMTSIDDPGYVEVLSSANPLPAFITVTPDNVSLEAYEGVLVQVQNVTVTNVNSGPGEWLVTALGQTATVDDMYTYTYAPTLYETLDWVRGPVSSELGNFKIQPRDNNDISATFVALPTLGGGSLLILIAALGILIARRRR